MMFVCENYEHYFTWRWTGSFYEANRWKQDRASVYWSQKTNRRLVHAEGTCVCMQCIWVIATPIRKIEILQIAELNEDDEMIEAINRQGRWSKKQDERWKECNPAQKYIYSYVQLIGKPLRNSCVFHEAVPFTFTAKWCGAVGSCTSQPVILCWRLGKKETTTTSWPPSSLALLASSYDQASLCTYPITKWEIWPLK